MATNGMSQGTSSAPPVQPLNPGDFQSGAITQPITPPIQGATTSGETPVTGVLSDAEKKALGVALTILKAFPDGVASNEADKRKLALASGYVMGFLEGKGLSDLGSGLSSLSAAPADSPYNQLVSGLDSLVNGPETRFPWRLVAKIAVAVAGALL